MVTQGLSVGGRIELPDDPRVGAWLWRFNGELLHLEMTPVHARRSVPQNRRLWAGYNRALRSFAELTRHDKDELHDAMKDRFIDPVPLYTEAGDFIGKARSTKRMSVPAFGDYMEQVSALFAGFGCDLYPEPRP